MTISSFWDSMNRTQTIDPVSRQGLPWRLAEKSYDQWAHRRYSTSGIPKRLHQIWLGSPLPRLYSRWAKTWKRFHPEWEYTLWTEKEIDCFGLRNRKSYEQSPNLGVKSDIVRYEILERLGGVYADTDFECLAAFDDLAESCDFFAGLMYGNDAPINNGLIGSVPGHSVLASVIDQLGTPFQGHDGMSILAYSGPILFSRACFSYLERSLSGVVILPTSYFYPFPNTELDRKNLRTVKKWVQTESLAVHYWEVSWRQQSLSSRIYWWLRKRLPHGLVSVLYRIVKGYPPVH